MESERELGGWGTPELQQGAGVMAQGQQSEGKAPKAQPSMPVLALTSKTSVLRDDTPASTVLQPHTAQQTLAASRPCLPARGG